MHIRHAIPADSSALASIQITSYRTAYANILPDPYLAQFSHEEETQDWRNLLAHPANNLVYVAEQDSGLVVGYALGRAGPVAGYPYMSELVALHVLPTFQRRGIGRRLFAAVASDLRRHGATSLLLWTLAANPIRHWYERLEGQYVTEKSRTFDRASVTSVAYEWPDIDQLYTALTR